MGMQLVESPALHRTALQRMFDNLQRGMQIRVVSAEAVSIPDLMWTLFVKLTEIYKRCAGDAKKILRCAKQMVHHLWKQGGIEWFQKENAEFTLQELLMVAERGWLPQLGHPVMHEGLEEWFFTVFVCSVERRPDTGQVRLALQDRI